MKFSNWVKLREQVPAIGTVKPGRKDDVAQTDMKIKKAIAGNLGKPEKMRKAAKARMRARVAKFRILFCMGWELIDTWVYFVKFGRGWQ